MQVEVKAGTSDANPASRYPPLEVTVTAASLILPWTTPPDAPWYKIAGGCYGSLSVMFMVTLAPPEEATW